MLRPKYIDLLSNVWEVVFSTKESSSASATSIHIFPPIIPQSLLNFEQTSTAKDLSNFNFTKKFSNICWHLTFTMDGFIQGQTDVLIVGAGPAGCMAASTLARYGIDFRLIDKRAARTQAGHASSKKTTTFVAAPSDF